MDGQKSRQGKSNWNKNNITMETKLNELQKALLWFEQNGFECYTDDDSTIYLVVNDFNIQVSTSEVLYRAELWDSNN